MGDVAPLREATVGEEGVLAPAPDCGRAPTRRAPRGPPGPRRREVSPEPERFRSAPPLTEALDRSAGVVAEDDAGLTERSGVGGAIATGTGTGVFGVSVALGVGDARASASGVGDSGSGGGSLKVGIGGGMMPSSFSGGGSLNEGGIGGPSKPGPGFCGAATFETGAWLGADSAAGEDAATDDGDSVDAAAFSGLPTVLGDRE